MLLPKVIHTLAKAQPSHLIVALEHHIISLYFQQKTLANQLTFELTTS